MKEEKREGVEEKTNGRREGNTFLWNEPYTDVYLPLQQL